VTVFLYVTRSCGRTEKHQVQADGDFVHVSHQLLTSAEVIGLEVEVEEAEAAPVRGGARVGASAGGPGNPTPGGLVPGSPGSPGGFGDPGSADPFFRLLDEIGWHSGLKGGGDG
jgi:hypothetical protein